MHVLSDLIRKTFISYKHLRIYGAQYNKPRTISTTAKHLRQLYRRTKLYQQVPHLTVLRQASPSVGSQQMKVLLRAFDKTKLQNIKSLICPWQTNHF